MKKVPVDVFKCAEQILRGVKNAALMTTKSGDGFVNTMVIGWGMLGIAFGRPAFQVFARNSRFTHRILKETGEFTVNIKPEGTPPEVLKVAGSESGRNVDKIKKLNLTTVASDVVSPPALCEFPLTPECKILYQEDFNLEALSEDIVKAKYPVVAESEDTSVARDIHTMYYAEIVSAYFIEE